MKIKVVSGERLGSTEKFLNEIKNGIPTDDVLKEVAENTIQKLKHVSPNEEIANSWKYEIERDKKHIALYFNNYYLSENGDNIVVLIDNGHMSKDGSWISGTHFTKQCFDDAYEEIFEKTREELRKL